MSVSPRRNRPLAAGIAGNVLEWYDFAVYGFLAPVIAKVFFPSEDAMLSLIAAYGAFAAGFLMRPLGGALFGHIGDRFGRKPALIISIVAMAVPSLAIGLLPTYDQIGIAAGVLVVVLRMVQGIAVGGEYTGSIVYLAEKAPAGRRGFFSSWAMSGANGGILLGSLFCAALSYVLTADQLQGWGWRVPFLVGLLVAIMAFALRRGMEAGETAERVRFPLGQVLRHHWKQVVHVLCLNAGFAVFFYIGFIYVSGWLVSTVHETHSTALAINSVSMAVLVVLLPLFARASDRIGRKPLMIKGAAGIAVLSYPLVWLMDHPDPLYALGGQVGFAMIAAAFMAPLPAALAEMFPPNVRVTAVSIGYNGAFAVFGGTAPMVATWLVGVSTDPYAFAWYMSLMSLVALVAVLLMRETATVTIQNVSGRAQERA